MLKNKLGVEDQFETLQECWMHILKVFLCYMHDVSGFSRKKRGRRGRRKRKRKRTKTARKTNMKKTR